MTDEIRYATAPLRSWPKLKEIMSGYFREVWQAREQGRLLVGVGPYAPIELLAGYGDCVMMGDMAMGLSLPNQPDLCRQCYGAIEGKGYPREGCAILRLFLGSALLGKGAYGAFPRPEFLMEVNICDSMGKVMQTLGEELKLPYFCFDPPFTTFLEPAQKKHMVEYFLSQFYDFMEWMEARTGRTLDEERLLEAIHNTLHSTSLWSEICILNQAVPAPLDEKTLLGLWGPILNPLRYRKETVSFYEMLRDEVKDRVQKKIAALATERYRLLHEGNPPWYHLDFLKYPHSYGAVFIGSLYSFGLPLTNYEVQADGRWGARKPPQEKGIVFKNIDEALRYLAAWYIDTLLYKRMLHVPGKLDAHTRIVKEWQVDALVIHLDRGCPSYSVGKLELKMALQEMGIPSVTYEASSADQREYDQPRVMDRMETFFESLGLKKLEQEYQKIYR